MEFKERYNNFQREILELKTSHDARSNMRTFFDYVTIPAMYDFVPTTIRLTYASGDQPIITSVVGQRSLIPLEPSGTTQSFIWAETIGSATNNQTFYFLSTRKIESIQIIQ